MRKRGKPHRPRVEPNGKPNFSGQHFLHDSHIVEDVINAAMITSTDTVLDIGAGRGAISFPLARRAKKVIAVEYDEQLSGLLVQAQPQYTNLKVVHQDFLTYPLPKQPFCVVSNIPYAITTPILNRILNPQTSLVRGSLIIEAAAARRFTATPITNPVILAWRMWFLLEMGRRISRMHFSPPSRVDSAVLLVRRIQDAVVNPEFHFRFRAFATYGLKYPHRSLFETWKPVLTRPQMVRVFKTIGVERDAPVHVLTVGQWGLLFNTMVEHVHSSQWVRMKR